MQGVAPAAPLIFALLTQLAAPHASTGAAQPLLLAVEAEAARIIPDQIDAAKILPSSPSIRVVIQASDVTHAERLAGGTDALDAIIAIGPQSAPSANAISQRGGRCITYEPIPHRIPRWRRLLFPTWVAREAERLPIESLKAAPAQQAFLVAPDHKPVRLQILMGGGASTFMAAPQQASHDRTAPPLGPNLPAPSAHHDASRVTADLRTTSAKLRRVLARKSAPPPSKGASAP